MNRSLFLVATCLFVGGGLSSVTAQDVRIRIVPAKDAVLEYAISTTSEMTTTRKRTVNGEERAGRGNPGPIKTAQNVVFREGPAGSKWRHYVTAEGSVTRNRNGEDQQAKIAGALAGKRIFVVKEEGKTVVKAGSETGETVPRQAINGVATNMNLRGLVPGQPVAVQGKYELEKGFAAALRALLQPVRPAATPRPAAEAGEGRGRRGGRGGPLSTFNDTAVRMLASKQIETKGQGELVSLEEKDGQQLATLKVKAVIRGSGTPAQLGLVTAPRGRAGAGRRGGGGQRGGGQRGGGQRGGGQRGGDQAGAAGAGSAELTIEVSGTVVVNQTAQRIASVDLQGNVKSTSTTARTTNRDGTESKNETVTATAGSFTLKATCTSRGAEGEVKKTPGN